MFKTEEPPIVLSVGGALIVPEGGINDKFLSDLNSFIRHNVSKGKRFIIVAGGGKTARQYRDTGKAVIGDMTDDDLDWLGIHSTRLNGHLLRSIFKDIAHPRIIENYDKKLQEWTEPIVIGAGWKPGWSTDYCAVVLAKEYKSNLIVNMSNIEWVYDKDPRKYEDAKPIKKLTWDEMEKLVGTKWSPGINAPFDPVATQLAKNLDLTVIVTNGSNFNNMENIIEGEGFNGTVITPYRIDASFYDREYYTGNKSGYKFAASESFISQFLESVVNFYRAFIIRLFLNPKSCLDVGCGTGKLVGALRRFGIDAFGVELSEVALNIIPSSIRPFVKHGDISKLPYEENQFDLVITFDVLEHIDRAKIKKSINETIRVSKKYILHKIYTRENKYITWLHAKDFSHISVFNRKYWQKIFLQHESVTLQRNTFFKLPKFFESIFLLKKK